MDNAFLDFVGARKERAYNFNAGPAVLPDEVLQSLIDNTLNYKDSGVGLLEMSHRTLYFDQVIEQTTAMISELLHLEDDCEVLYVPGGATMQFSMVPLNLLPPEKVASYIITGLWAKKAAEEARKFGKVLIAASSVDDAFRSLPKNYITREEVEYCHFTSNNTVYGTQFQSEPWVGDACLVCDASSDFMSKPLDMKKYSLIYAGAQKNLGPAGVTIVVIKKKLLEKIRKVTPANAPMLLKYKTYAESNSMYNTPPVYAIFVVHEVAKWMLNQGGLEKIHENNKAKSKLLYDEIDSTDFYKGYARKEARSLMNVTFNLPNEELERMFVEEAEDAGLMGLKGHRAVGGIRASLYNAFPLKGVEALVEFMKDFEKRNG